MTEIYSMRRWKVKYSFGDFIYRDPDVMQFAGWETWKASVRQVVERTRFFASIILGVRNEYFLDGYYIKFATHQTNKIGEYDEMYLYDMLTKRLTYVLTIDEDDNRYEMNQISHEGTPLFMLETFNKAEIIQWFNTHNNPWIAMKERKALTRSRNRL